MQTALIDELQIRYGLIFYEDVELEIIFSIWFFALRFQVISCHSMLHFVLNLIMCVLGCLAIMLKLLLLNFRDSQAVQLCSRFSMKGTRFWCTVVYWILEFCSEFKMPWCFCLHL